MATLTLRRAAVTYSRGPKGMKAWQLLLGWLTPAERAYLTRSGGILQRSSVGQDGSPEYSRKH